MEKKPIRLFEAPNQCSGCGACVEVCPKRALQMVEGQFGCKYPVIDGALCVGCGKCKAVCTYQSPRLEKQPTAAYAVVGKDNALIKRSASGGAFASMAMRWIDGGGAVAGAIMEVTADVQVYHILASGAADIRRMQGSKYVHSDAWRCYGDVAAALKTGKQVLFSGTPCQVAAVKALTGDPDNLTTIDLICHGVPPLKMLNEYVRVLERRFVGKVTDFVFRDKQVPKAFCTRVDVRRGKKHHSYYLRSSILSYYRQFLDGTLYRENCYSCPYARLERVADVTIGDYWGIHKFHADEMESGRMPRRTDWSCVLVNTEKGQRLLDTCGKDLLVFPSKAEWVAEQNYQLCHPSKAPAGRTALLQRYANEGYAAVESEFQRKCGGRLRYYVRLWKQIRENAHLRRGEAEK